MIEDFKIKGLEKMANSGLISKIYPMVDRIEIKYKDTGDSDFGLDLDRIDIDIFLNDNDITSENMYDMGLDPHYLVDKYLKNYLPYFNIDRVIIDFIVWNPDGEIIYSYQI